MSVVHRYWQKNSPISGLQGQLQKMDTSQSVLYFTFCLKGKKASSQRPYNLLRFTRVTHIIAHWVPFPIMHYSCFHTISHDALLLFSYIYMYIVHVIVWNFYVLINLFIWLKTFQTAQNLEHFFIFHCIFYTIRMIINFYCYWVNMLPW